MTDKQTINVGNIENAKRIWIATGGERVAYWPCPAYDAEVGLGGLESRATFDERRDIEADAPNGASSFGLAGFYNDDGNGEFYLFCEADCFDPPQYLIRANGFEAAYEIFIEEFASVLDEVTLADYDEDSDLLYHTSRGAVDTESINGCETTLVRVDC